MDDYRWYNHNQVPAFGSWDYGYDMPYTQCFETARQAAFLRYQAQDRDLYVAGDLYQNDVVTPTVIVVPRRRRKVGYEEGKKQGKKWGYSEKEIEIIKEAASPVLSPPSKPKSMAVDEDLYKIPPEFLHAKPKRKKGLGLFSSCLLPGCCVV